MQFDFPPVSSRLYPEGSPLRKTPNRVELIFCFLPTPTEQWRLESRENDELIPALIKSVYDNTAVEFGGKRRKMMFAYPNFGAVSETGIATQGLAVLPTLCNMADVDLKSMDLLKDELSKMVKLQLILDALQNERIGTLELAWVFVDDGPVQDRFEMMKGKLKRLQPFVERKVCRTVVRYAAIDVQFDATCQKWRLSWVWKRGTTSSFVPISICVEEGPIASFGMRDIHCTALTRDDLLSHVRDLYGTDRVCGFLREEGVNIWRARAPLRPCDTSTLTNKDICVVIDETVKERNVVNITIDTTGRDKTNLSLTFPGPVDEVLDFKLGEMHTLLLCVNKHQYGLSSCMLSGLWAYDTKAYVPLLGEKTEELDMLIRNFCVSVDQRGVFFTLDAKEWPVDVIVRQLMMELLALESGSCFLVGCEKIDEKAVLAFVRGMCREHRYGTPQFDVSFCMFMDPKQCSLKYLMYVFKKRNDTFKVLIRLKPVIDMFHAFLTASYARSKQPLEEQEHGPPMPRLDMDERLVHGEHLKWARMLFPPLGSRDGMADIICSTGTDMHENGMDVKKRALRMLENGDMKNAAKAFVPP